MSTIYFTTASLEGFLADQEGSLDWLFEVPREVDPHEEVGAFFSRVGAYAMGATTYQWMLVESVQRLGQSVTVSYRVKPRPST